MMTHWGKVVGWGAIAGLVGGIVMAMMMMMVTALSGMGLLAPVYAIAATFNPSWAATRGFDLVPLLVGLMVHMMNSAIFGAIFAALLWRIAPRTLVSPVSLLSGMVWGALLLGFNQLIVLPALDKPLLAATSGIFGWWLLSHLMFGAVLGALAAATLGREARTAGGAIRRQAA